MNGAAVALVVMAAGVVVAIAGAVARRTDRRDVTRRPRQLRMPRGLPRAPANLLPDRLEALARDLRAGSSLPSAIVKGPPGAPDPLAAVARRVAGGVGVAEAVASWAAAESDGRVRIASAGLIAAAVVGGPQARVIDATALALRERAAEAAERHAQSAQAGASAVVLVALPLVVGGWSAFTDRRVAAFLFTTPAGLVCAGGGALLIALGAIWMRRLVRVEP